MKAIVTSCAFAVVLLAAWVSAGILGHSLETRGAAVQSGAIDIEKMTREAGHLPAQSFDAH